MRRCEASLLCCAGAELSEEGIHTCRVDMPWSRESVWFAFISSMVGLFRIILTPKTAGQTPHRLIRNNTRSQDHSFPNRFFFAPQIPPKHTRYTVLNRETYAPSKPPMLA
jgi:hypothetical protein